MDINEKKQRLNDYKNRRPEMGIICFRCLGSGEAFLGISKDTKADFNSNRFKLLTGTHPNKQMVNLWKQHGEAGFEFSVLKLLKYDDPQEDHTKKLESLLLQCMEEISNSSKIWK